MFLCCKGSDFLLNVAIFNNCDSGCICSCEQCKQKGTEEINNKKSLYEACEKQRKINQAEAEFFERELQEEQKLYEKALKERASTNPDIVLTGFLRGNELKALYQYAGLFVLPSSHEGLPISLLEALSFGLPCLASGIPANRSVGLGDEAHRLEEVLELGLVLRHRDIDAMHPVAARCHGVPLRSRGQCLTTSR